uniref:TF-B3 domain-containing protein n=1 Tax=Glycine max TaxID=3847 RepID=A0A0R0GME5_SOYBN
MVGQNCDGCRSWEEDIYWSHFQFLHFVQFLHADYDQHLALPKTFSDNLKKKLPENVTLKGPGGVMWNIGMTTRDDTLYFGHGWEQFVKDHCLKENDFLVFKYNGGSLNKKRDTDNDSLEEGNIPSNAGVECALHEKSAHVNGTKEPIDVPPETPPTENTFNAGVESSGVEQFTPDGGVTLAAVPSETANGKRIRNIVSAVKHVHTKRKGRPAKWHVRERTLDWVAALEAEPVSASRSGTYEVYKSNRRPVTDDETRKIESLAKAACTDDSIYVVMKPTHVYKRFFVENISLHHLKM